MVKLKLHSLSFLAALTLFSCSMDSINANKVHRQDLRKLLGTWVSKEIVPDEDFAKESEFLPEKVKLTFTDCDTKRSTGCTVNIQIDNEEAFDYNFNLGIYGVTERSSINFKTVQEKYLDFDTKSYIFVNDHSLLLEELHDKDLVFTLSGPTFGVYSIHMSRQK